MRGRSGALLASVLAILAAAGPAGAQVQYGSIVGNVTDTSQAPVPGAAVVAIQTQTNLAREAATSGGGGYAFANLPEGTYTVRISLQGFKESVTEQVPVSPNTVSRIDTVLEVGALTETVTVLTERTLLQTDTGDLHSVIESEEITSLPLGSYRNYQTLLNLVPGTTPVAEDVEVRDVGAPLHLRSYEELLAALSSHTNLRAVPDPASATGYRLEVGPFPGWVKRPEW